MKLRVRAQPRARRGAAWSRMNLARSAAPAVALEAAFLLLGFPRVAELVSDGGCLGGWDLLERAFDSHRWLAEHLWLLPLSLLALAAAEGARLVRVPPPVARALGLGLVGSALIAMAWGWLPIWQMATYVGY